MYTIRRSFLSSPRGFLATSLMLVSPLIYPFVWNLSTVFKLHLEADRSSDFATLNFQNQDVIFDFIIVGGGSAGSSLASKLSKRYSVLVLEAGCSPSQIHILPTMAYVQLQDPSVDWTCETVPQQYAGFGMNNNTIHWPSAKVLGGSSLLNAMIYIRGNVQGFDEIAAKTGNKRWSMNNVLRYYRKVEDYKGWYNSDSHGHGGPVSIERPTTSSYASYMMRAGEELGYPERDPNAHGPYTEGFAKMDLYLSHGMRMDAYQGFLHPAELKRSNQLVVRKFAHVTRVLVKETTLEAYGVEYMRHGKRYVVKSRREVILSAGTIHSPQILMLSGIGPKEHLRELGIDTLVNLPIGQNLQDKYGALVGPFLLNPGHSLIMERDLTPLSFIKWLKTGKGKLRTSLSEGTWAILTESAKKAGRIKKPNIHAYILSVTMPNELRTEISRSFNLKPEVYDHFAKAAKQDSFLQLVTLNNPIGKGTLRLRDSNPFSQPLIDPKYLENDNDTLALVEGVKFAVKIVEDTIAMQEINARLMPGKLPGCEAFEFKSDSYYECFSRHVTLTAFKYAGTVPIGKGLSDPEAVVDSHLRVLGVKRLRVVDGSVLQQKHTSINDITCRMLGQLAADIIMDDWKYP